MKMIIMAGLAGVVLGACVSSQPGYRTEARVIPGPEDHQYVVQFKITDVAKNGKADVLAAPKLVVKAGEEAKIAIADGNEQNGVFCTALVKEAEGSIEVVTTLTVKSAMQLKSAP